MGVRYRFDSYVLDVAAHELRRDGELVPLPARTFECLCCLIEARERAVGRDELVQAVFGRVDVSDAQLAQIVLRTRRAIGDDGQEQRMIRTVPRFGFRWVAPVEVLAADAVEPAPASMQAATPVPTSNPAPMSAAQPDAAPARARPADDAAVPHASGPAMRRPLLRRLRNVPMVVVFLVLAAAAGALSLWFSRADDPTPRDATTASAVAPRAVVVLPVAVDAGADASWARLGLMDFVADRLRRGGLPVPSSEGVLGIVHAQSGAAAANPIRSACAAPRAQRGWSMAMQGAAATDGK